MKKTYTQRVKASALICFLAGVAAMSANAQSQYFTTVANGGTYSWDDPNWNPANSAGNTGPYTSVWTAGQFARFYNGAGDNFTVNVNAAESMAGLFLNAGSAATLNINNGGSGSLSVVAGTAVTQNGYSWLPQGFLTGGGTVNINASITGAGGVEEESGGGNLNLYGNNSFTGGFLTSSSATFVGFNNANSFGGATSQIGFDGTTFTIMNNTGASGLTIANAMQFIGTGGVNWIGNSVNMNGTFYLGGGSSAINLRNNGTGGANLTFGGVISATSGNVTYSGANGGFITLGAQNTYTGTSVIGSSGDTSITVQASVANAILGGLTMAGGKFSAGGFNQSMGTLGMTVSSTIMFGSTANTTIALSGAAASFTGGTILNISDWQGNSIADGGTSTDLFRVGTSSGTLTTAEEAQIEVDGDASTLGKVIQDASGYLEVIPEPSSLALGAMGGLGMLWMAWRRKKA